MPALGALVLVGLLVAANTINIAADIGAMAGAVRLLAGELAFAVFALGIIGTGLLAVPVLAGSAAYATSEVFGWKSGLSRLAGRPPV